MSKEQQMLPAELANEATQYGIEPSKAANIVGNLPQITSERDQFVNQYDEIIKMDIEDPNTSKVARDLRLKIRDNRTKGIAVWHKTTKDYFLKGGQFVDAIKRKEEAVNVRMEEALEEIEKYQQIKMERERDELRRQREEETHPYREFVPYGIDLGTIPEEEYKKIFNGAKLQYEFKLAEDKRIEEERQAREKLEMERANRINKMMPYIQWIENYDSINFDTITDEEMDSIIADADKKRSAELQARAEAEKKAAEAERLLAEERKKADQERQAMEDQLRKEKERNDKIEAELKKKKAEEDAKAKKLKNASDKAVLNHIAELIQKLGESLPAVKGEEAIVIVNETKAYLDKIAVYVNQQAELLTK